DLGLDSRDPVLAPLAPIGAEEQGLGAVDRRRVARPERVLGRAAWRRVDVTDVAGRHRGAGAQGKQEQRDENDTGRATHRGVVPVFGPGHPLMIPRASDRSRWSTPCLLPMA